MQIAEKYSKIIGNMSVCEAEISSRVPTLILIGNIFSVLRRFTFVVFYFLCVFLSFLCA